MKDKQLGWLGIDQQGNKYVMNQVKYPRKWLLDYLCRKRASVMWIDRKSGPPARIGWIIAGLWISVYRVMPLES